MHTAWGVVCVTCVCVCVWGGELQRFSNVFMNRVLLEDAYFLCIFASNGSCTY